MEQNTKEYNRRQIAKIQKAIKKAKSEDKKIVGYLAGGYEYYFKSLTTIRRANLISAILWIVISILLSLGLKYVMTYTIIPALQTSQSDTDGMFGTIAFVEEIVLRVLFAVVPIIMSVLSVKAFKFKMSPSELKKYFIWNLVITLVWAVILLFVGGIPGILVIVCAVFSGMALANIESYRDWFMNFGDKKIQSRSEKKSKVSTNKNCKVASKDQSVAEKRDDGEYYDDEL